MLQTDCYQPAPGRPEKIYYPTTTLCPVCEKLIPGEVASIENRIFVIRNCAEHGYFEGLICSDREWYENLDQFDVTPVKPAYSKNEALRGCPEDCGLCSAHQQIAGTAAIEISNKCNMSCPVCLADNQDTFELSVADVEKMVETMFRSQDYVDAFVVSGGEPTIHPQLFEILEVLDRPEIGNIAVNTNGLRIASDDAFLDKLAEYPRVNMCLHYDGENSAKIRGIRPAIQKKALERLDQWNINATPVVLAVKEVNEHEIGDITSDLLTRNNVRSTIISVMTYAGSRGSIYSGQQNIRLTIPDVLNALYMARGGVFNKGDFIPLPMPNPICAAIGYFLVMDGEITALNPLIKTEALVEQIKNSHFGKINEETESFFREVIDNIYANPNRYENSEKLLGKFRFLIKTIFSGSAENMEEQLKKYIKPVYLMQLMDRWSFDSVRLTKCSCQHVLRDGRIVPSCHYYTYLRRFEERSPKGSTQRC